MASRSTRTTPIGVRATLAASCGAHPSACSYEGCMTQLERCTDPPDIAQAREAVFNHGSKRAALHCGGSRGRGSANGRSCDGRAKAVAAAAAISNRRSCCLHEWANCSVQYATKFSADRTTAPRRTLLFLTFSAAAIRLPLGSLARWPPWVAPPCTPDAARSDVRLIHSPTSYRAIRISHSTASIHTHIHHTRQPRTAEEKHHLEILADCCGAQPVVIKRS